MAFCCRKFHLVLVTEARLDKRARMTTNDFNVFVFQSSSGCQAIRILGNGKHRRCKTLVQHTVHSEDFPNYCGRNWHLDYMVGEGFLGRSRHQWQFCDSLRHWVSSLRRCAS